MNSKEKNAIIALFISVVIFTISIILLWSHTIDDTYISIRYAENLSKGYGLIYQLGDAPVEGYSNFLFVLLISFFTITNIDPVTIAKLLSCLFGYLCLFLIIPVAKAAQLKKYSIIPILWVSSFPAAYWSVNGMETSFVAFMVLLWLFGALLFFSSPKNNKANLLLGASSL